MWRFICAMSCLYALVDTRIPAREPHPIRAEDVPPELNLIPDIITADIQNDVDNQNQAQHAQFLEQWNHFVLNHCMIQFVDTDKLMTTADVCIEASQFFLNLPQDIATQLNYHDVKQIRLDHCKRKSTLLDRVTTSLQSFSCVEKLHDAASIPNDMVANVERFLNIFRNLVSNDGIERAIEKLVKLRGKLYDLENDIHSTALQNIFNWDN